MLNASAVATDNNLSANPATQNINLTGFSYGSPVTVNVTGTGSGAVSSSPSLVNCAIVAGVPTGGAAACSPTTSTGFTYSFFESPISGYTFTGWGGACSNYGSNQICSLEITAPTTIVANFAPVASYSLTVAEVGTGSGSVTDGSQIICSETNGTITGSACSGSYSGGAQVTLTASVSGNSIFAGWGGACSSSGTSATCNVTMNSALNVSASFVAPGATQSGSLMPITAGVVYGQGGSFTSVAPNNGGVANGFSLLSNVTVDASGNLYVADGGNNRVLFYPQGSTTPTRVYGQNGSFTSNSPNIGGAVSANGLSNPIGVVVDSSGDLYVADQNNNRVLFYPVGQTTPTRVYGQPGFNTGGQNFGGISASSLFDPWGLAVDAGGGLYVADYVNSRVLFYPAGSTTATRVYGQNGSFTSNSANNGGVSADSLSQPTGVALDASGDLYVADIFNNRVLFYPNNSTTATVVYGQNGSFTSNSANNGGVSADSLNNPMALTLDSTGDLYVIDHSNNRLLFYPFGSTTATRVYGQAGSFTDVTANSGGISANSLSQPLFSRRGLERQCVRNGLRQQPGARIRNLRQRQCLSRRHQNTPAPCKTDHHYELLACNGDNLGATQVVTQGVTGLDFTLANGGTCTGVIAPAVPARSTLPSPHSPQDCARAQPLSSTTPAHRLLPHRSTASARRPLAVFGPGTQSTLASASRRRIRRGRRCSRQRLRFE